MSDIEVRLERIETMLRTMIQGERPSFDPEVFSDPSPKFWDGPSFKGKPFSACPPDYLRVLASAYEKFAQKSEAENVLLKNGKPKADWDRKLATAARDWARFNAFASTPVDPF